MGSYRLEPDSPEQYARHHAFVRRLAVQLSRSAEDADDLSQETWLLALTKSDSELPRSWFARALRLIQRGRRRAAKTRRYYEAGAGEDAEQRAASEVAESLEAQERVARAVAMLEEPYRTALFLRFYEDLPVRSIAERLGVPADTVKTRVRRGLERLRRCLAQHESDHEARSWCPAAWGTFAASGGVLMVAKTKAGLLAAMLALTAGGWWTLHHDVGASEPPVPVALEPSNPRAMSVVPATPEPFVEESIRRPSTRTVTLRGEVLTPELTAVAGARVEGSSGDETWKVTTDREGRFEAAIDTTASVVIHIRSRGFLDEEQPLHLTDSIDEVIERRFILFPDTSGRVMGRVKWEGGGPVANGRVYLTPASGRGEELQHLLMADLVEGVPVDSEGQFRIEPVPCGIDWHLWYHGGTQDEIFVAVPALEERETRRVRMVVPSGIFVGLNVVDAKTGVPLPANGPDGFSTRVEVQHRWEGGPLVGDEAIADGECRIEGEAVRLRLPGPARSRSMPGRGVIGRVLCGPRSRAATSYGSSWSRFATSACTSWTDPVRRS